MANGAISDRAKDDQLKTMLQSFSMMFPGVPITPEMLAMLPPGATIPPEMLASLASGCPSLLPSIDDSAPELEEHAYGGDAGGWAELAAVRNSEKRSYACSNPACQRHESADIKFLKCPCGGVQYCCTACQKADYKVHKRSCPIALNKSEAGEGGQTSKPHSGHKNRRHEKPQPEERSTVEAIVETTVAAAGTPRRDGKTHSTATPQTGQQPHCAGSTLEDMAQEGGKAGEIASMFANLQSAWMEMERCGDNNQSGQHTAMAAMAKCVESAKRAGVSRQSAAFRQLSGEDMTGTPGYIRGDEPAVVRASMYVDLLLAPSGEACLVGEPALFMQQVGQTNLMLCTTDELECIAAFAGLHSLATTAGAARDVGVAMALRPASLSSLCLWIGCAPRLGPEDDPGDAWRAERPERQGHAIQADFKRPFRSPADAPLPLPQQAPAYAQVMTASLELLRAVCLQDEIGPCAIHAARSGRHTGALLHRLTELASRACEMHLGPLPTVALELLNLILGECVASPYVEACPSDLMRAAAHEKAEAEVAVRGGRLFGACVQLRGLKTRPELNNCAGVVSGLDSRTGRYKVSVAGNAAALLIKGANIEEVDEFGPG